MLILCLSFCLSVVAPVCESGRTKKNSVACVIFSTDLFGVVASLFGGLLLSPGRVGGDNHGACTVEELDLGCE